MTAGSGRRLQVERLCKRYGDTVALQDMTFTVEPGELFGFVGSNGAGKTTTMRIALGVLTADSGHVHLGGQRIDLTRRRSIGYMPEERGLYPKMKVGTQLSYLAQLHGFSAGEAADAVTRWTARLGIDGRVNDTVDALSLGNQQRVQLAGSYTAVVEKKLSIQARSVIASVVRQQAVNSALSARGVNPATLTQAADRASVTIDAVHPPKPHSAQRTALAYIAIVVMFFQILAFGLYVAIGVVEEKSSRVVEVLLATIKPLHLLCGKGLGIGAVGLVQLVAYGVVGLGAGIGTGLVTVTGTAVGVFASVLVWFILGYAFFAVLYAAAGSLVSRQEDVNSVATPITMLILVSYFLAQATVRNPSGTLAGAMSWIPPFSAMLMPLRIAAGATYPAQIIGSAILMVLVSAGLAVAAARIYQRSVLHTGTRMSWTDALRARA